MPNSPENQYSFNLTIGSDQIPINLRTFEISLSDSIYSLCPEVTFTMHDISGLMLESRLNILGQNILLTLNDGLIETSLPLTCTLYEMPSCDSAKGLSGTLAMKFKHTAKFSLKEAKGYANKSPADVFKELFSNMDQQFNSFNKDAVKKVLVSVQSTSKCTTYPLILNPTYDNEEFTDNILLKLATNGNPSGTPFFGYIDVLNNAHFESLEDIYNKAPYKTLVFGQSLGDRVDSALIFTLQSFSQDYNKVLDLVDGDITFFNENYEIESQDTSLSNTFNSIALMKSSSRRSLLSPNDYSNAIDINKELGNINNERRKGLLIDKLVVSTIMDLSLCAGKTVEVETYLNTGSDEKANSYSGKFIIEASEHHWDPTSLLGYTHLVLGRISMTVKGKDMG